MHGGAISGLGRALLLLMLLTRKRRSPQAEAALIRKPLGHKITRIGRMTEAPELLLVSGDGTREPLKPEGYQHFRRV